jgi:hypothetical protein
MLPLQLNNGHRPIPIAVASQLPNDDWLVNYAAMAALNGMKHCRTQLAIALSSSDALKASGLIRLEVKLILKYIRGKREFANNVYIRDALPPNKPELEELLMRTIQWQRAQPKPHSSGGSIAAAAPAALPSRAFQAAQAQLKPAAQAPVVLSDTDKAAIERESIALLQHPSFKNSRSPYHSLETCFAHTFVKPEMIVKTTTSTLRYICAELTFDVTPKVVEQIRKLSDASHLVLIRLFSSGTHQHVPWNRNFTIQVNALEVPIVEPNYYMSSKKKEKEIVRGLDISKFLRAGSNLVSVRMQTSHSMFQGIIAAELVCIRSTSELVQILVSHAEKIDRVHVQYPCIVCQKTESTSRCSVCRIVWYCCSEHQRDHWPTHRTVCKSSTTSEIEMFDRAQWLAYRTSTANCGTNGRVRLKTQKVLDRNIALALDAWKEKTAMVSTANRTGTSGTTAAANTATSAPGHARSYKNDHQIADDDADDDDLMEGDTMLTVQCPLSLERCKVPARGRFCNHLTCFDVETYLEFSEQSGYWQCPICPKHLPFDEILPDLCMRDAMHSLPKDVTQLKVDVHGEWEPVTESNTPSLNKNARVYELHFFHGSGMQSSASKCAAAGVMQLSEEVKNKNSSTIENSLRSSHVTGECVSSPSTIASPSSAIASSSSAVASSSSTIALPAPYDTRSFADAVAPAPLPLKAQLPFTLSSTSTLDITSSAGLLHSSTRFSEGKNTGVFKNRPKPKLQLQWTQRSSTTSFGTSKLPPSNIRLPTQSERVYPAYPAASECSGMPRPVSIAASVQIATSSARTTENVAYLPSAADIIEID